MVNINVKIHTQLICFQLEISYNCFKQPNPELPLSTHCAESALRVK